MSLGSVGDSGFGVQPPEAQPLSLGFMLEERPKKVPDNSGMLWEFP